MVVVSLPWLSARCTFLISPYCSSKSTAYTLRKLCGATFCGSLKAFAAHFTSFQTACLVLGFSPERPGKAQIGPACRSVCSRSSSGKPTMRRLPVLLSVTQKRGLICSVRSASTSPMRKPVCKLTWQTSAFDGVSARSTASTSLSNRYSVLILKSSLIKKITQTKQAAAAVARWKRALFGCG